MSSTLKTVFLASNGMPDWDGYFGLTELSERYPTFSIVLLSGLRDAMLGALQQMFGGSINCAPEIRGRNAALVQQQQSYGQPV